MSYGLQKWLRNYYNGVTAYENVLYGPERTASVVGLQFKVTMSARMEVRGVFGLMR